MKDAGYYANSTIALIQTVIFSISILIKENHAFLRHNMN